MSSQTPSFKTSVSLSTSLTTHSTTHRSPTPFNYPTHGSLFAKGLDTTNTTYLTSFDRTPIYLLPFPHPKYHMQPLTGKIYEVVSPIFEEYDPVTRYIESVDEIRRSVDGGGDLETTTWNGCVRHPESRERSSLRREAERVREEQDGDARRKGEKKIREI